VEPYDSSTGKEVRLALRRILFDHYFIFTGHASYSMAVFFADDGRLILVFLGAIYFGQGHESLAPKIQTFLQYFGLDHSSGNLVCFGLLA
jgi:hypothetical protein